jgi:hypothetical protein
MLQLPPHIAASRPALAGVLETLERKAARAGGDPAGAVRTPAGVVDLGWPIPPEPAPVAPRPGLREPGAFRAPPAPPRSAGLERGAVHEFFAHAEPGLDAPAPPPPHRSRPRRSAEDPAWWLPPMGVLLHVARRAALGGEDRGGRPGAVVFVGRRVWPAAAALAGPCGRCRALADRTLLVDAGGGGAEGERLWAVDLCLRSPGVTLVVADGSGLSLGATRRLQLAAAGESSASGGGRALAALARPPWEVRELSAAQTRWAVRPCPDAAPARTAGPWSTGRTAAALPDRTPRWTVELLRSKGDHALLRERRVWRVGPHGREGELMGEPLGGTPHGEVPVRLAADVRDRPVATA